MKSNHKKIFNLFNLSEARQQKATLQIKEGVQEDLDFYILSFFSAIVITLGLILDNASVIIGGMLMASLVWPMLALALAIAQSNIRLFKISLFSLVKVGLITLIVSYLIGLIWPFTEFNHEIVSRTQPSILELVIALVAGFVAFFVISCPRLGSFISGVVVAAAVMPPLCVIGLFLAQQNLTQAGGAFLLFFSNLIAVLSAATIFFILAKFKPPTTNEDMKRQTSNISRLIIFLMIIVILFSIITGNIIFKNKQYKITNEAIVANLKEGKISELEINEKAGVVFVSATIRTRNNLSNREMNSLASIISKKLNQSVNLQITIIPTLQGEKIIEPVQKTINNVDSEINKLKDKVFPKTKN